jgi:hypothetical protein
MWVVEQPVPVKPSPKAQLQVTAPTPPEVVAAKLTDEPTSVVLGVAVVEVTAKPTLTVTDTLPVAVTARASRAVTVAVNGEPTLVA